MRKQGMPAVAVLIIAAGLAIAGATARPAPSAGVSQQAATVLTPAMEQLIATGVLPKDVRLQPGVWNYAGPAASCPGPGWKCVVLGALAAPIVQAGTVNAIQCVGAACVGSSQTGVVNTFKCEPEGDAVSANGATLQECVIDQEAEYNRAICEQKKKSVPFMKQRCSITQTGIDNAATIVQVIDQTGGDNQGAVQEAGISQTSTEKNAFQVKQEIKQFTQTLGTQNQDAYQVVGGPFEAGAAMPAQSAAMQTGATGVLTVDNQADINQKQFQHAEGGTTLDQNDGATMPLFDAPAHCNQVASVVPPPNACVNLEQRAGSGDNQSQLSQAIENEGVTEEDDADQQQGSLTGGIDDRVHQESTGSSSSNQASLSETQTLVAGPDSTQMQFGPGRCCGVGSQIGDGAEQIQLKAHQRASEGEDAIQELLLESTSVTPDGTCAHEHSASNNAGETSESFTFDDCDFREVVTECANPSLPSENGPLPCRTEEVGQVT